ncbi:LysR family transcriptional regulator [Rugamonas rivuli]|uniref:LysR family transcriptional regulator n=1 Tax=Rugamonas rivuli TaxID=2743358 RepID=A0A843SAW5_9BURK|nr:LysR family transcriptional regulator [Rugamonas rivuli]MQA21625.1 LysR family transcriptional regulator [Rugamonas rivuli]
MDSLSGISLFVAVAEARSFTKAGTQFGISSSAVGKSIARMEQRLAVRLFHRSTRSITLTAEGTLFLERCRRILSEVEAAEAELSELSGTPSGRLRVSTPQLTGLVMPTLTGFMRRYPDIALEIDLSERMVDIIEEGYDAVIRTGSHHDSRLASRRIGACPQVVVASPGYLAKHGTPSHPRELAQHHCLLHRFPASGRIERWPFKLADGEPEPQLNERMTCSTVEAITYALLQGEGIAFLPTFIIEDELKDKRLQIILADYMEQTVTFTMLWPASRYASPKLRVFIDYVVQNMRI